MKQEKEHARLRLSQWWNAGSWQHGEFWWDHSFEESFRRSLRHWNLSRLMQMSKILDKWWSSCEIIVSFAGHSPHKKAREWAVHGCDWCCWHLRQHLQNHLWSPWHWHTLHPRLWSPGESGTHVTLFIVFWFCWILMARPQNKYSCLLEKSSRFSYFFLLNQRFFCLIHLKPLMHYILTKHNLSKDLA